MTPKERALTAINHAEPDRVPINLAGTNSQIDKRLKEHFGLAEDDNDGLLDALNVDFRCVDSPYVGPKIHQDLPDRHVDPLWGIRTRWIRNESGGYWDYCDFPLKDATMEIVENWPMPDPDDFDYDAIAQQCEKYKQYCTIYGGPGLVDIMNSTGMLRTMEQVYMDIALEDEVWLKLVDRKTTTQLKIMQRVLDTAKGKIDLIWTGEDLGSQNAPLMSKNMFRKILSPQHQRIIDLAKTYDLPVMIHSCGSSSWAFDDFIEMGINVADTLQPEAKDMSPEFIKQNYGGKLAFHGCISTAGPMAYGSAQKTADNVKETIDIMKPGGGYVMCPTHMIQDNSPTENVVAAYKAVIEYGSY